MFQFKLDGQIVEDPIGWDKFQETLEFDDNLKGVLSKFNSKLTFHGAGYAYLREQYRIQGYCHLVDLEIKEDCGKGLVSIFKGFIFLSDVKFTISEKCLAECSIEDQSFSAKINNNKSTEAKVDVARSKNDVAITAAPTIAVNFRDPLTLATTRTVDCWDVQEVFRFMIEFMTDGTVGFASDFLTNLPTTERIAITYGLNVRSGGGTAPTIKFKHLFEEIHKKYNTYFSIELNGANPVFRLEQRDYYLNTTNSVNILNIKELSQAFDNQLLYSHVKLGSEDTQEIDAPNTNTPQVNFITFLDETFNIQGDCNIDRELDLQSKWQVDTNVIEHALNGVDDTYDEDTFIIQYEQGATNQTSNINYLGLVVPVYGFNDQLRNSIVAERFNMQGAIALLLGDGDDEFSATSVNNQSLSQTAPVPIAPVQFENEITDVNGNYCVSTEVCTHPNWTYEAPATGVYNFGTTLHVQTQDNAFVGVRTFTLGLVRRTAGGALIERFDVVVSIQGTATYSISNTQTIYLNVTDYVEVEASIAGGLNLQPILILEGSSFACDETNTGGGVYQPKQPENYYTSIYEFRQPLSREKWNDLKTNLAQSVNFDGRQGWIKQIVHTYETKETQLKLLSNG